MMWHLADAVEKVARSKDRWRGPTAREGMNEPMIGSLYGNRQYASGHARRPRSTSAEGRCRDNPTCCQRGL